MKLNRFTAPLWDLDTFYVFNDFEKDQSDIEAVDTVTDSGTVAIGDEVTGVALLTPSDGSVADNDEAYLATPNEVFKVANGKPLYGRFRGQFTEVAAGAANAAFGFQNAVGADSIVDNGAGLKVSGSTFAVYKVDGEQVWRCVSSVNGTAVVTQSTKAAVAATQYVVEVETVDHDSVSGYAVFRVDGEYLKDTNGNNIRHKFLYASATEMQMFAGIKLGAATNNDTLKLDYWYGAQKR